MVHYKELKQIPENVLVLTGKSLLDKRHLPVPPGVTAVIRNPEQSELLYEILREEYPENHPLELQGENDCSAITLEELKTTVLSGMEYLVIPPLPENRTFENFQNTASIISMIFTEG